MTQSQKMRAALSKYVFPNLIEKGFVGKYPLFKRIYSDRIELIDFGANKLGNSFGVAISTVFLPESKRDSNCFLIGFQDFENANVYCTSSRYCLKGMCCGEFYYTDVYREKVYGIIKQKTANNKIKIKKTKPFITYKAVGETKAKNYVPSKNEVLVQKADENIYYKVCELVNRQLPKAFEWWDAFNKNDMAKMKRLNRFRKSKKFRKLKRFF